MKITPEFFNPDPIPLSSARPRFTEQIAGAEGAQGIIVGCDDTLRGLVAKLYHPSAQRDQDDLRRTQGLISMCSGLREDAAATREWFDRLNLPLRPIVTDSGKFCGVFLPPLPPSVSAAEHKYNPATKALVPSGGTVRYEAQYLASERSVIGFASAMRRWRVMHSLAETVAMMHSANLVHGDLSLSNVLVQSRSADGHEDAVYLIDLDDAILDAPGAPVLSRVRRSRPMYDPDSVAARLVNKRTDVFVVALWVVALTRMRVESPSAPGFGQGVDEAMRSVRRYDRRSAETIKRALGDMSQRPSSEDLYDAVRRIARTLGVA